MPKEYGFLINGEWMPGGKKREIRSPYNGETAGIVSVPDRETAIGSVGLAESAYEWNNDHDAPESIDDGWNACHDIDHQPHEFSKMAMSIF